jgi:hypothetical protein
MASELPVLGFLRLETPTSGRARQTKASVLLIDKRDGRQVFQHTGLNQGRIFSLSGDLQRGLMTLRLPMRDGMWTLRFTDKPRPPEPPAGHELLAGSRRGFSRIAAAAIGALVRQAEQLNDLGEDIGTEVDELESVQEDDPE